MLKQQKTFKTRNGVPGDASQLAKLHVKVWRETYRDVAPIEVYEMLDEARRMEYWSETLESTDPAKGAIVAEDGDEIVGVISFGKSEHPIMDGAAEVKHLYVLNETRGTGTGKRLLHAAFDHLRNAGFADIALAVVKENESARSFYRAVGGTESGEFVDLGPLWLSSNIVVTWHLPS